MREENNNVRLCGTASFPFLGNAISVGRAANVIAARLPAMLHVRLVGSLEHRIARFRQFDQLDRADALKPIRREDGRRRRYIKEYFDKDVDDPLLSHFVINTDWVPVEATARTMAAFALDSPPQPTAKSSPKKTR